jgi:hypothetical protein
MASTPVVAPDGEVRSERHQLAARPRSVSGLRIAVVENTKPNARTLLSAIAEGLVARGAAGYDVFDKPNPAVGFRAADRERLADVDLVLTGSGD